MWLSSVLSSLMLTSFCLAVPKPWDPPNGKLETLSCGISALPAWYSYKGKEVTFCPWMIMVFDKSSDDHLENIHVARNQICGGSLIHYKAVLTSAACINGKGSGEIGVRAGKIDKANDREIHQDRQVLKIVTHPAYDSETHVNDFAILVLQDAFTPAANVITVCLPTQNQDFVGLECPACGWGVDDFKLLDYFDASVISRDSCKSSRSTFFNRNFEVDQSFICTEHERNIPIGVCNNDEGGPLACQLPIDGPRYVQAGVISKRISCGKTVAVYSNVAVVRGWIDDTFRKNGI